MPVQIRLAPKVSIILPVYNGQAWLDETLQSLVDQTFNDFELLVIDDGSTDQSVETIKNWVGRDQRIQLIMNGAPHGLPHALNRGLLAACGQYIARADQDDIHRPTRLSLEVAYLDAHPTIMLIGTGYQPFSADGKKNPILHPASSAMLAWKMITQSAFCHPSVMFRRQVYNALGGYPVTGSEDFAYFSKVVRRWPATNLPEVLVDYREHATNYSITKREAMRQSVQATYLENIQSYLGSTSSAELFYDFLVRRHLPFSKLFSVGHVAKKIVSHIGHNYNYPLWQPGLLAVELHVYRELFVVGLRTWLGRPPIGPALVEKSITSGTEKM